MKPQQPTPETVRELMTRIMAIKDHKLNCAEQVEWLEKIMQAKNDLERDDPLLFKFMTHFSVVMAETAKQRKPTQDECFIRFSVWLKNQKPLYNRRAQLSLEQLADDAFYDYTT